MGQAILQHTRFWILTTLCSWSLATSSANLPSYPLAVKSPYLSAWMPGSQIKNAATGQPQFWTGQSLTWSILARVGSTSYTLFGVPGGISGSTAATTKSVWYSSSHTYVTLTAGSATFALDFFSPVFPGSGSYAKQSLPYSYLTVNATNSRSQSIQVLSAIDQTWTAQGGAAALNWTTSGSTGFFWFYNSNAAAYTEKSDMAAYGSVLYGTTVSGSSVTHTCDTPANVYMAFTSRGTLTAKSSCSGSNLAAVSKNLGTTTSGSVTFAIGFDRVQAIQYLGAAQTGYFRKQWPTVQSAISYFLGNYQSALSTSLSFDAAVRLKALSVSSTYGSQYADILEASVRQTFGGLEITVPANNMAASPYVFLKEISSDGNVNTVDFIYQTWPIFVSLNPEYIKLLFAPILDYLKTGGWPYPWVIHDIGFAYPNATGHNDGNAEQMPLFETSSLFILLLDYQQYTGDSSFAKQYSSQFPGWANYLAQNSLYPASQLISVDAIPASANQTALAMQAAIGLNAAATLTGNKSYADTAASIAKKIYNDALGLDGPTLAQSAHFTYNYGSNTTWNVIFAAYSDVILNLTTFPSSAWALQSSWYAKQMQAGGLPFAGPPSDRGVTWALTDWNFVAAAVSSAQVQQQVVNSTWTFMTNGKNSIPFGTKYYVEGSSTGLWVANKARSTVGSHFAMLALQQGTWGNGY
ncbi:Glutaminase A [Pseudocercospora fuligena]|uniref:Glutaminase A n=1 Tax=Pseudocercospora fuligena TaxID=685502 RepID=A0A8H6RCG6_9PEZI|nr:Glutaminase A [Pseudocercospora fuligena]